MNTYRIYQKKLNIPKEAMTTERFFLNVFPFNFFFPHKKSMGKELAQHETENEDFPIAQAGMK